MAGESRADETLRFRGDMPMAYAQALVKLTRYAREHDDEFDFGPLDLASMRRSGLVVSGPDLSGVAAVLSGIPGLVEVPA